jgi:uncharacterized protein (TIGR03067 family)
MRTFALVVALLAVTDIARAEDIDPEPSGTAATLKKLKGTWNSVRIISGGMESPYARLSYTFDGEKATYRTIGPKKGLEREMTLKLDKNRKDSLELTYRTSTTKYHFKIEKDELFLVPDTRNDPKAKPDFTGNTNSVIVYKQEKK